MVASILTARARSFGNRACNRACKGQTIAMMNSAKVSGAKTGCATPRAATTRTAIPMPSIVRSPRSLVGGAVWMGSRIVWKLSAGAIRCGEHAKPQGWSGGLRRNLIIVGGPEARIAMAEGVLEVVVQHGGAYVEEGLHCRSVPTHLLLLVHALGNDLVDRTLDERRGDRLTAPPPGSVVHHRVLVASKVAKKFADVSLNTADAGDVAHVLAFRPTGEGLELAPTPCPATVPQAPLRTLQATNRLVGKRLVGQAARRLQRMLEARGDVPLVQHQRGRRQRLALQPPQPGITIAQHRRRRVRVHASRTERLRERFGRDRLAVAGEGEAVPGAIGVDHLACDYLEMALLLPVPAAHVAAVKPNHDGVG